MSQKSIPYPMHNLHNLMHTDRDLLKFLHLTEVCATILSFVVEKERRMYQGYHYTLESVVEDSVFPPKITTKYPLQAGMYVQIPLVNGRTSVFKVKEIVMYSDDAVVVVGEV